MRIKHRHSLSIYAFLICFWTFQDSDKASVIFFSVEGVFMKNLMYWHPFLEIVMLKRSKMTQGQPRLTQVDPGSKKEQNTNTGFKHFRYFQCETLLNSNNNFLVFPLYKPEL